MASNDEGFPPQPKQRPTLGYPIEESKVLRVIESLTFGRAIAQFHEQKNGVNPRQLHSFLRSHLPFDLKKAVDARGGFEKVCELKQWSEIRSELETRGGFIPPAPIILEGIYRKWIYPYEVHLRNATRAICQQPKPGYGGPLASSPAPSPVEQSNPRVASPTRNAADALQEPTNSHAKEGRNGGQGQPIRRRQGRAGFNNPKLYLPCPFASRYPEEYKIIRPCYGPGWTEIHRIK